MKYVTLTDVGKMRDLNEDACYAQENRPTLFIVADGLGGHLAGEVASKCVIESASRYINLNFDKYLSLHTISELLHNTMEYANEMVRRLSMKDLELRNMGTTMDICIIEGGFAHIGHVGDSRCYLFRDNKLVQKTEDHSYVNHLLKSGIITDVEAKVHPKRHLITRAIGLETEVESDIFSFELLDNDIIMMCTDGLTNMVDNEEIIDVLKGEGTIEGKCKKLVDMANENGGMDNITVAMIFWG